MAAARRPRALAIMGPTACGKTALALALRELLPVDIISVDSAQVYRGMDIGTAKPDAETLARAPHRLIDIRDPAEAYSAAAFVADAHREMDAIRATGRIPLLVGGTMLYFQALTAGIAELPAADPAVRAELDAAAARLHPNHSQRIQRALEIYRTTGQRPSRLLPRRARPVAADYELEFVALIPGDRALLHHRIERRFAAMVEAGLVDEVRALRARGDLHPGLPALRAAGYRQVWAHLAGECDAQTMIAGACAATRQLAKRQLTWLRGWREPMRTIRQLSEPPDRLAAALVEGLRWA